MDPQLQQLEDLDAEIAAVYSRFQLEAGSTWDVQLATRLTERIARRTEAFKRTLLAEAQHREPRDMDTRILVGEWRALSTLSARQADAELKRAQTGVDVLPVINEALAAGDISIKHADVLIQVLDLPARACAVDDDAFERMQVLAEELVGYARTHTSIETKSHARSMLITKDPREAQARHEAALALCDLTHEVLPDGVGVLRITGPVQQTLQAFKAIQLTARHDAARREHGDTRRMGRRRSELALGVLLRAATAPEIELPQQRTETLLSVPPEPDYDISISKREAQRRYSPPLVEPPLPDELPPRGQEVAGQLLRSPRSPVLVNVTTDLPTLVGIAQHPMLLDGTIPITAEQGRSLFDRASFTRLLLEPDNGQLIDASPWVYEPNRATRDIVVRMHPTCRAPGCTTPADQCQIDHATPFNHDNPQEGGATVVANLGPLCVNEHQLKTLAGFGLQTIDGVLHWTTPAGQQIPIVPFDLRPTKGAKGPQPGDYTLAGD